MKSFGPRKRTKAEQRTSLQMMLVMRETLDGLQIENLARSYGVDPQTAKQMLNAEMAHREKRA